MTDHDPLCNWYGDDEPPGDWCNCTMYDTVRADERERDARAIEEAITYDARKIPLGQDPETTLRECLKAIGMVEAARIVRNRGDL